MSHQEAFDHAGDVVVAGYREWEAVVARVPAWGAAVDAQVRTFIDFNKTLIIANLDWR
jgi:hypothetical protein